MTNKEFALKKISELVEKFGENVELLKRIDYNEKQTRIEFINPFFKALGWDIDNEQNLLESYQEVRHEDKIKVNEYKKAPDYSFNLNGKRKFFVEAKKPFIDLKNHPEPALQVRNYGWNGKLLISRLTDFEEFCIYDCTKKTKPTDRAIKHRLKYLKFTEYIENFDFLYDTFSKQNVLAGSIEKYFKQKIEKSTETVDKEFLKSLEKWRTYLATSIALKNNNLDEYEINYAVQQIIDRIVFLKICEDRGIESIGNLKQAIKKGNYYENLFSQFHIADQKYNFCIFDFHKDKFTQNLKIENKIIKEIINDLYETGYDFSIIPIEILGFAYEQFLGKVIRLESSNHAVIEEKPEVRKAGGVYYTPEYIVEYIVNKAIGKLIENKTPNEISEIKILDTSCGSGSFLIGAYQYLLDWHLRYYNNTVKDINKKNSPLTPEGRLTTSEKKRILMNNIHGVDIDNQAVEVTKLSLLIKCLEGETNASIDTSIRLFHDRILPNIDKNILCGNTLIESDYYKVGIFPTPKEMRTINTFNWNQNFKDVLSSGGFDIIIGNPPYLSFQQGDESIKNYFKNYYKSAVGKYDQYVLFIEKASKLLKHNGFFGFIIPNKFINSNYGEGVKSVLLQNQIIEIIDFGDLQVFEGATNYPCILLFSKLNTKNNFEYRIVKQLDNFALNTTNVTINQAELTNKHWQLGNITSAEILTKIYKNTVNLSELTLEITQGLRTGHLELFFNSINSSLIKSENIEKELIKSVYTGKNVKRFYSSINSNSDLLLFPYKDDYKTPADIEKYPNAKRYLYNKFDELQIRKDSGKLFKETNKKWFEYWDSKPICFTKPKIVFPDISKENNFFLDTEGFPYLNTCYAIIPKPEIDLYFLLAVLNSRLIQFIIKQLCPFVRGGYYRYKTGYIKKLPIVKIDSNDVIQKNNYESIIKLCNNMINYYKQFNSVNLPTQKQQLQQIIDYTNNELNRLVYELYCIDKDDIIKIENMLNIL